MAAVELGAKPVLAVLNLVRDSDFTCVLHANTGDWPVSCEITVLVAGDVWLASLDGADATFSVDLVDVNAAIAMSPRKFKVFYEDGAARFEWMSGPVSVRD